jgi:hypothetical protein
MSNTAVVIFAFNRPDHLTRTLEQLSRAERFLELPFYFFIDGPRNDNEKKSVDEVLKIANTCKHPNVNIQSNTVNKGLRPSIISGLSQVFKEYEQAIVLEDDILVHTDFINYHLNCLDGFKTRSDVWSVSGFVIPQVGKDCFQATHDDLVLAPRASSWGWSTWKVKWEQAIWDNNAIKAHFLSNYWNYHKTGGDKLRMLTRELSGNSSSWAIIWDYNHFLNSAFCVYPSSSLVSNIGLDYSGTHSKPKDNYSVNLADFKSNIEIKPDIQINKKIVKIFSKINLKFYRLPFDLLKVLLLKLKP